MKLKYSKILEQQKLQATLVLCRWMCSLLYLKDLSPFQAIFMTIGNVAKYLKRKTKQTRSYLDG